MFNFQKLLADCIISSQFMHLLITESNADKQTHSISKFHMIEFKAIKYSLVLDRKLQQSTKTQHEV
jgi:hypothetical protein